MKVIQKSLIYSMITNFTLAIAKVLGGLFYGISSLYADGMHTFTDFITDIFALIGSKVSKKRPTKLHPFGFGRAEYITNLLIGLIVIVLGLFILISSFGKSPKVPALSVVILLIVVSIIKMVMILYLTKTGKKINSSILLTAAKESMADIYSTIGVVIIVIIMQFSNEIKVLEYADIVGSIIISFLVIKTGIPIIKQNVLNLIGEVDINPEVQEKINYDLVSFKQIKNKQTQLIKYGQYYKIHLTLELDPDMTLRQISKLEKKIIKKLKNDKNLKIKYINIDVVPSIK